MRCGLVKPFMHFIPKSMHQCADRQILALKYSHSCSHKHVYVNGNLKNINLTVNISPSVRCICNSLELLLGMMQVQLRFWMQESHEKKKNIRAMEKCKFMDAKKSKLITFKIEKKENCMNSSCTCKWIDKMQHSLLWKGIKRFSGKTHGMLQIRMADADYDNVVKKKCLTIYTTCNERVC